jgi:hypothetical protein
LGRKRNEEKLSGSKLKIHTSRSSVAVCVLSNELVREFCSCVRGREKKKEVKKKRWFPKDKKCHYIQLWAGR